MSRAPGPWEYRPHPHDDWGFVRASNDQLVAVARHGLTHEPDYDAHRAAGTDPYEDNGRLIAATLDLLAALRDALANPCECGGDCGPHFACWRTTARAAIAKAEGTTP